MDLPSIPADPLTFHQTSFFQPIHDPGHGTVVQMENPGQFTDGDRPAFSGPLKTNELGNGDVMVFLNVFGMFRQFTVDLP